MKLNRRIIQKSYHDHINLDYDSIKVIIAIAYYIALHLFCLVMFSFVCNVSCLFKFMHCYIILYVLLYYIIL